MKEVVRSIGKGRRVPHVLVLLLIGLSFFLSILTVAENVFLRRSASEPFLFKMRDEKLILPNGRVFTLTPASLETVTETTTKMYNFKILDGEGYNRAWEKAKVQEGVSSLGRPIYMATGRFLGLSPDDEPGTNYTGWFEMADEWFEFRYNVTIQSTETIPISGTGPTGHGARYGSWDHIIRIVISLSWQPSDQTIVLGIIDDNANSGYGCEVTGGYVYASFTPPYDPTHFHSIVIGNPEPSTVSYSGTIWVIHGP